jgi:hypothetical protein
MVSTDRANIIDKYNQQRGRKCRTAMTRQISIKKAKAIYMTVLDMKYQVEVMLIKALSTTLCKRKNFSKMRFYIEVSGFQPTGLRSRHGRKQ